MSAEVDAMVPRRTAPLRLPWLLLAVSLALNLFFVAGAFWVRNEAARTMLPPAERFQAVAHELALETPQRQAFERFVGSLRMRTRHMRENNQPILDEVWHELAKSKPDDAVVDRNLEAVAKNRLDFQLETSHGLRAFLATLSDEQRAKFIELAKDRQNHKSAPLLRQLLP